MPHVTKSDNNDTRATKHHITIRSTCHEVGQQWHQSHQTSHHNSGSFGAPWRSERIGNRTWLHHTQTRHAKVAFWASCFDTPWRSRWIVGCNIVFSHIFVWSSCFWFCTPACPVPVLPPPALLDTHNLLTHNLLTPNLLTQNLSTHNLTHTQNFSTQNFAHTQLTYTYTYTHNLHTQLAHVSPICAVKSDLVLLFEHVVLILPWF